jgi:hypothetical protein
MPHSIYLFSHWSIPLTKVQRGDKRVLTGGMVDGVGHGVLLSAAHGGEGEATASQAHGGPTLQYQPGHSDQLLLETFVEIFLGF